MRILLKVLVIGGLVTLGLPTVGWAQSSRSPTSTRSLGGTTFGSSGSSRGSSGVSGASMGIPSLGSTAQVSSSDRFVRGNRQAGAFVGTDSADTQAFVGQVGAGTNSGRSSMRRSNRNSARNQAANRQANNSREVEIRSEIRLGFAYEAPAQSELTTKLAGRLDGCSRIQSRGPYRISVDGGGMATLRGVVATEHDRMLAEMLIRLEPGVRQVQNDLTVAQAAQPAATPPAAAASPTPSAASVQP